MALRDIVQRHHLCGTMGRLFSFSHTRLMKVDRQTVANSRKLSTKGGLTEAREERPSQDMRAREAPSRRESRSQNGRPGSNSVKRTGLCNAGSISEHIVPSRRTKSTSRERDRTWQGHQQANPGMPCERQKRPASQSQVRRQLLKNRQSLRGKCFVQVLVLRASPIPVVDRVHLTTPLASICLRSPF